MATHVCGRRCTQRLRAEAGGFGLLLWAARAGLLAFFVLHIASAWKVTIENRRARPVPYAKKERAVASFASWTMIYSGILILAFVLMHLSHFTFHWIGVERMEFDSLGRRNIYRMVIEAFQNPVFSAIYIGSMVVLGLHLSHGISSLFQTLGLTYKRAFFTSLQKIGTGLAWAIAIGYISIPCLRHVGNSCIVVAISVWNCRLFVALQGLDRRLSDFKKNVARTLEK